jgi:uncharacterized pyridoxamine 5'-phosphate oxidase family protein
MKEILTTAKETLQENIGQDRIMALATRNGEGVASRTVNVYTYKDDFYFVTEENSNKYAQMSQNNKVALSADAIQITGNAILLDHPCSESNKEFVKFVETQLPGQMDKYSAEPLKRLIKIEPVNAGFILLQKGQGYAINYEENMAFPIKIGR